MIDDLLLYFRFQDTKPNLTKAIEYAGEKLFDTGLGKRQYMKEILILIVAGDHEITQRVQHVVGYMKMRGVSIHLFYFNFLYLCIINFNMKDKALFF